MTISNWTRDNPTLPALRESPSIVTTNGYVYVIGGRNTNFTAEDIVYRASLNTNGKVGEWLTENPSLHETREFATSVIANGYVYVIGGVNEYPQGKKYSISCTIKYGWDNWIFANR